MRGHEVYLLTLQDWIQIILERYLSTIILSNSKGEDVINFFSSLLYLL